MSISNSIIDRYIDIKKQVIESGFAWEIDWQEEQDFTTISESKFCSEAAWVILSSGMSVRTVTKVFSKVSEAFFNWDSVERVILNKEKCIEKALVHFNHVGKINAIVNIIEEIDREGYINFKNNIRKRGIDYLQKFPFLGPATSYHLAKNIGVDVVKPDRHLINLANELNFSSVHELCKTIASPIDEKMSVVDIVLWRYCVITPDYISKVRNWC